LAGKVVLRARLSFLEKRRGIGRRRRDSSSQVLQDSCSISVLRNHPSPDAALTSATLLSAGHKTIVHLRNPSGRPVVNIFDGRSRRWIQMEFSSWGMLLYVLSGDEAVLQSIEASLSRRLGFRKNLDWAPVSLWLRSILLTSLGFRLIAPHSVRTLSDSGDTLLVHYPPKTSESDT